MRPVCEARTSVECEARCDDEHVQRFTRRDSVFESPMFWAFFLLNILAYSGNCVVTSMGDAIAFSLLGDAHAQYGAQRVWGSIGWGLFTIIAGEHWCQAPDSAPNESKLIPSYTRFSC